MADPEDRSQVEVFGLPDHITDDFLILYFENQRRSGGGPIQSNTRNGSVALLTFSNTDDAESVLSRAEHRVQGAVIRVRRAPPWDRRKVALCGLDPETSEVVLELYVENVSGREDFSLVRSADKLTLIVTFTEELTEEDFQRLEAEVQRRSLHQRSISVLRMRVSGDLLVQNIGSGVSADLLEMYFESRRSGGAELQSVTMLRGNSAAIVSYRDWRVAQNVLSRPSHSLQNCQLSVSPFYPDLLGSLNEDSLGEPLEEETPDFTAMEQSGRQEATDDQEDTDPVKDPKPDGEKETPVLQGGFNEVHMEEVQQTGPKVQQTEPEVHHTGPEVHHTGPEVHHTGPDVHYTQPEVHHRRPEVHDLGPEVQQMEFQSEALLSLDADKDFRGALHPCMIEDHVGAISGAGLAVQEEEVVMEAAELRFMQEYNQELLMGMDAVTIFPLDELDRFGFKVAGDSASCRTAVEVLQHILSSLSSRTITLDYPGVAHFLLESKGKNALRQTEQLHQCIIDTTQLPAPPPEHELTDPWRFIDDVITPELPPITDEKEIPLPANDAGSLRVFASLLQSEGKPESMAEDPAARDTEEDLNTDEDSSGEGLKDEELQQVCELSLKEYRELQLDEEAQLLLAIQRSMDTRRLTPAEDEDEEMQRALEMSLLQPTSEDTEDFQRVLELSLREQRAPPDRQQPPAGGSGEAAQVRVLAADETGLVVACAALRKAVLSHLHTVSVEAARSPPNLPHIVAALERKHRVRITTTGGQIQIQGFLRGPSQCQQELQQILDTLQARERPLSSMMSLDAEQDVTMTAVPEDSEEYKHVLQPFLKTLHDVKLTIDILQLQKIQNPLLYNQYQLKKQRMSAADPGKPVERILYHGTSEGSAREICHHGFNRSFCGKNAVLYGQGVYFASVSELSTRENYSPPNSEGKKFVLVARVLTGEFTVGKADMRTPPLIPDSSGNIPRRYDSLVNSMERPTIYVIFNDTQAYPEYLITCSNRRDTTRGQQRDTTRGQQMDTTRGEQRDCWEQRGVI